MELILWRHAEAENPSASASDPVAADLRRRLTVRGHRQAELMAEWLHRRRDGQPWRVLASPASRAQQTAAAFGGAIETCAALAPGASAREVLAAVGWPDGPDTLVVGHQPWIGETASLALSGRALPWSVRKAGILWLASRERDGAEQSRLRAAIDPSLL